MNGELRLGVFGPGSPPFGAAIIDRVAVEAIAKELHGEAMSVFINETVREPV